MPGGWPGTGVGLPNSICVFGPKAHAQTLKTQV